jgi:uncharacterized protein YggE
MKRLFAIFALLLMFGAPLAQPAFAAEKGTGGSGSTTTSPDGEILD